MWKKWKNATLITTKIWNLINIFEEWFEHTLIPNLKPNSVIVMDNASYHSRQISKIPSTSSNKEEIQIFLMDHDLYFEECYTKKQLLEVLRTKTFEKKYVIENIARQYGHSVLRLPPYFCVFNPIELIWGQLKKNGFVGKIHFLNLTKKSSN